MSQSEPFLIPMCPALLEDLCRDLSLAGRKATFQLRCRRQEAPGRGPGRFKTWKSSTGLDLPFSGTAAPDVVTKHQSGLSRQETGVVRACASEELF